MLSLGNDLKLRSLFNRVCGAGQLYFSANNYNTYSRLFKKIEIKAMRMGNAIFFFSPIQVLHHFLASGICGKNCHYVRPRVYLERVLPGRGESLARWPWKSKSQFVRPAYLREVHLWQGLISLKIYFNLTDLSISKLPDHFRLVFVSGRKLYTNRNLLLDGG